MYPSIYFRHFPRAAKFAKMVIFVNFSSGPECAQVSVDLLSTRNYDYGDGMQLYEKNISLDNNATVNVTFRSDPTWLSVDYADKHIGFLIGKKSLAKNLKNYSLHNGVSFDITEIN